MAALDSLGGVAGLLGAALFSRSCIIALSTIATCACGAAAPAVVLAASFLWVFVHACVAVQHLLHCTALLVDVCSCKCIGLHGFAMFVVTGGCLTPVVAVAPWCAAFCNFGVGTGDDGKAAVLWGAYLPALRSLLSRATGLHVACKQHF
jgi:hypothetical protein